LLLRTSPRQYLQQVPVPSTIAKVFMSGRSQAVRLPEELRLSGKEMLVSKAEGGLLLEPVYTDVKAWFAAMDEFRDVDWPVRERPPMPRGRPRYRELEQRSQVGRFTLA
jgi:antitoxin VapB